MNNIKQTAAKLETYGRNGDTMLAHITPEEAQLLKSVGGSGTINPKTGLPEYFLGKAISGIVGSVANIFTGADSTKAAGEQAAAQQRAAAQGAAFRPVGMTTRFGSSQFTRQTDPATGLPYISSAGYTAAPELAGIQDRLFGGFPGGLDFAQQQAQQFGALSPASQQIFGLGQDYLATTPAQARQDFIQSQQAALAPGREQQLSGIRNQLFQTGRGGLATGGTMAGGMQQTNPELAAYYNALAQQDLQLAAGAEQAAQQRIGFGAGLFGTGAGLLGTQAAGLAGAYSPLQTQLGLSGQVEQMAQMPYQLGIQLGQAQQPGQQAGVQGLMQAAQTQYGAVQAANAANAQFWGGLIGAAGTAAAGGAFGGGGGAAAAPSLSSYMSSAGVNPGSFSGSAFQLR